MDNHFDFDQWMALARKDPAAFETKRQLALKAIIDGAPIEQQRRLKGMQFQIDAQRGLAKSEMDSMLRLSKMMHVSFRSLRGALNDIVNTQALNAFVPTVSDDTQARVVHHEVCVETAKVLPFKKRA